VRWLFNNNKNHTYGFRKRQQERKGQNDNQAPPKFSGIGLATSDKGGNAADTCLPSFDQRVTRNELITPGINVILRNKAVGHMILFGETEIGNLTQVQSAMVIKCSALGINYKGVIVGKKGTTNLYARFSRIPG
jgi:hypothetical protein